MVIILQWGGWYFSQFFVIKNLFFSLSDRQFTVGVMNFQSCLQKHPVLRVPANNWMRAENIKAEIFFAQILRDIKT